MTTLQLSERGNGFPEAGELIGFWDDGEPRLFRLIGERGTIQTHQPGWANTCVVEAEEVDADEVIDEIDLDDDDLALRAVSIEVLWRETVGDLMSLQTGEYIREATASERDASIAAADRDGGVGAITVEIDGAPVTCYVED